MSSQLNPIPVEEGIVWRSRNLMFTKLVFVCVVGGYVTTSPRAVKVCGATPCSLVMACFFYISARS